MNALTSGAAAEVLVAHDPDRLTAAERLLRELVADLNAIDEKFHMIDTLRREQAWDAYCDLAQGHGVPRAQAETWFDEERRF